MILKGTRGHRREITFKEITIWFNEVSHQQKSIPEDERGIPFKSEKKNTFKEDFYTQLSFKNRGEKIFLYLKKLREFTSHIVQKVKVEEKDNFKENIKITGKQT